MFNICMKNNFWSIILCLRTICHILIFFLKTNFYWNITREQFSVTLWHIIPWKLIYFRIACLYLGLYDSSKAYTHIWARYTDNSVLPAWGVTRNFTNKKYGKRVQWNGHWKSPAVPIGNWLKQNIYSSTIKKMRSRGVNAVRLSNNVSFDGRNKYDGLKDDRF